MNNIPESIHAHIKGKSYSLDKTGMSGAKVLCFDDMVLKIEPFGEAVNQEYEKMLWLQGRLPVPEILCREVEEDKSYLLMSRMPGEMACSDKYFYEPE